MSDVRKGRKGDRRKTRFVKSCAVYSLIVSVFLILAPLLLRMTDPPLNAIDSSLDVLQSVLGSIGVVVSLTFYHTTNQRHLLALGCSWLAWMLASFLLSICALHQLIIELVSGHGRELVRIGVDTALTLNAPVSIYFILLFVSSGKRGRRRGKKERGERKRRRQREGENCSCSTENLVHDQFTNTLWKGEPELEDEEDEETIVYYV